MSNLFLGSGTLYIDGVELVDINIIKPTNKPSHSWNGDLSTCIKCGDKDWMADEFCSESLLVKPSATLDDRFTVTRTELINDNYSQQPLKK